MAKRMAEFDFDSAKEDQFIVMNKLFLQHLHQKENQSATFMPRQAQIRVRYPANRTFISPQRVCSPSPSSSLPAPIDFDEVS